MKPKHALFSFPNSFFLKVRETCVHLRNFAGALLLMGLATHAHAGGGGENMLLIVNPNDESALRIANAYVQARHIPVNNILYIVPPSNAGVPYITITAAQFTSTYQNAIPAAIAARGLTNQIDYIGTIGQPHVVITSAGSVCFQDVLTMLTQYQNGMALAGASYRYSELFNKQTQTSFPYVHGTNAAIHHSTHYPLASGNTAAQSGTLSYIQWYLPGMIGYTGVNGLTTNQVIQNLQRTVAGDGAKPTGIMFFENSNDIRTLCRINFWPLTENYMVANNLPWIQEQLNGGATAVPANRTNVMGAEIGIANYFVPNGCVYLPGSWADSLTSFGALYGSIQQTLGNTVLLSGGGGSSGTIVEPGADPNRFPMSGTINIYSNDGATLGEAFYSTVNCPDLIQFQGDLLSQAYADIPTVAFTSAPANGAAVSGSVVISGSAFLPNLTSNSTATGIASIALFVDGLNTGAVVTGASGSFILDTTTLTDGVHEVRLVAFNNSAAASEGCAIKNLVVNNLGQSVGVTGSGNYNVASNQTFSVPVSATQGSGPAVTGIQLQSLGRAVGSLNGASGNVSVSGTSLIYGNNTLVPVAILSGGQQVQGLPITVTRQFQALPGLPSTLPANRNPGCDIYYYPGAAQKTIAATNFSGPPACVTHFTALQIGTMPAAYRTTGGGSNAGLAVAIKSSFTVTTPGEYTFAFTGGAAGGWMMKWTSSSIAVDGVTIFSCDLWNGSTLNAFANQAQTLGTAYLLPGEHTVTVKLANVPSGGTSSPDANLAVWVAFRGVDANVRGSCYNTSSYASGPYFYTLTKNVGN